MAIDKSELFKRRRARTRHRLRTFSRGRLRLSVHRSNKNISAQLIDDSSGETLAAASSLERSLEIKQGNNIEAAARIGAVIAERAKIAGIDECYLDRGGYLYHGRVRAFAEAARSAGLRF